MPAQTRLCLALGLVAVFGSVEAAAEAPRFGVQVHGSLPLGDLKEAVDSKPGVGAGAHMTFDLGGGHMLRPRFDAVFFPEGTRDAVKTKARDLSLGADYLYFPGGKPEGLYLTAGLGLHRWTVDTNAPAFGFSTSQSSSRFGVAAGLGFAFNPAVGAELRYVHTKFANQTAWDPTAPSLQAGVTFRF